MASKEIIEVKKSEKDLLRELPEKEVIPKFKISGYYINQKTKGYERGETRQLSLFNNVSDETKKLIDEIKLENPSYEIIRDVKLTPAEDRLMNVFLNVLYDEVIDPYFETGNIKSPIDISGLEIERWGDKTLDPIVLEIGLNKVCTDFHNNSRYSGKHMANMLNVLSNLLNKRYQIAFKTKWTDSEGEERINRIDQLPSLIEIVRAFYGLTPEQDEQLDNGDVKDFISIFRDKGSIIVKFCPIFIDQIKRNYLEYPKDINKRTALASGGVRKVTESIVILRDYLRRQIKINKDKKEGKRHSINKDDLIYKLGLGRYKERNRLSDLNKTLEKAFNACINNNLNLITDVKEQMGSKGQPVIIFTLNFDWLN